jgi:magnesium-transporting ATPase (P-type)
MMILWANLVADIPPALALGIDNESSDIMARKPRNPKTGVFTKKSAFVILYNGLSMAVIALVVYIIAIYGENYDVDDSPEERGEKKLRIKNNNCVKALRRLWRLFL